MQELMEVWRFILRLSGFCLAVVGVVTAAYEKTFAGFIPIIWFLLALCCFFGVVCITLFRIEARLESKTGAKMKDYTAKPLQISKPSQADLEEEGDTPISMALAPPHCLEIKTAPPSRRVGAVKRNPPTD